MARAKSSEQATAPQPAKPYQAGDESFEVDGKKYSILVGKFIVPDFGLRTAGELALDPEAQKALLAIAGQTIVQELV